MIWTWCAMRGVAISRVLRCQEEAGAMRIFTIGYEGATQPELIAALTGGRRRAVIDVRAVPLSRKPGFSKNVLAAGLREAGIDYVHLKALGTPPAGPRGGAQGPMGR